MRTDSFSAGNHWTGLSRLPGALCLLFLGACAFNFNGTQISPPSETHQSSGKGQMSSPDTPLPIASEDSPATGQAESPLGLQPMGGDQSSASQLMTEGTLGYLLDHLFGGSNPHISAPYLPQPGYSTTTAGGVPGGLWPGNWWIQGQGGGYNLTHLP